MSDSAAELLSKADALLKRWRGGSPTGELRDDYPVLTEVVEPPTPKQTGAAAQPSTAEISDLEVRVQRRVLQTIEPELAAILAGGVHDRLEEAVRRIAAELTGQVSKDISGLVHAAVRQALEHELDRLRADSAGKDR